MRLSANTQVGPLSAAHAFLTPPALRFTPVSDSNDVNRPLPRDPSAPAKA